MSTDGGAARLGLSSTVPAASAAFSAHAPEYTALRRRLVPSFDAFYGAAVDALRLPGIGTVARVLDLGAGTGLLSALVLDAFPSARFDLLDGSGEMLSEARQVLGGAVDEVFVQDMAAELPGGPYDAVISALAIHHLEDPDKRLLFRRVFSSLRAGGVFVNAEQVASVTAPWSETYRERWAADAAAQGGTPEEIAAAVQRRTHDRCASVPDQLSWLIAAGFSAVDCLWKHWEGAVLLAQK